MVDAEGRALLNMKMTHILSNVHRVDPSFDIDAVVAVVPSQVFEALAQEVKVHMEALV